MSNSLLPLLTTRDGRLCHPADEPWPSATAGRPLTGREVIIRAAAAVDGDGRLFQPARLRVRLSADPPAVEGARPVRTDLSARPMVRLLEIGSDDAAGPEIRQEFHTPAANMTMRRPISRAPDGTPVVHRPDAVVLPALVNAHTHLDLSAIGPVPPSEHFIAWVDRVRERRPYDAAEIERAVRLGLDLSHAGGVAAIGDIAGVTRLEPWRVMRADPRVCGVSFVEFFGQGSAQATAVARMGAIVAEALAEAGEGASTGAAGDAAPRVRLGLQPHAPYSAGLQVYEAAVALSRQYGLPLSTHLAETLDELEFVASATGRFRELIERLGKWDDAIAGTGLHPIAHLAPVLRGASWTAAHINYADPAHLDALVQAGAVSVAYCPRASAYFGHVDHPYRVMLERGLNVCLGTDSLLCLDTPGRISVLDEIALLHHRDGTSAGLLLRMATVNGARALGLEPDLFTLKPGHEKAGLLLLTLDSRHPAVSGPGASRVAADADVLLGPALARLRATPAGPGDAVGLAWLNEVVAAALADSA